MPTGPINVFTVGFTKKTAGEFFEKLRSAGIKRVVDVRLNNVSQLAGFSKRDDLKYFLKEILDVEYVEAPLLAPTQPMLDAYKKSKGSWDAYEHDFLRLMKSATLRTRLTRRCWPAVASCAAKTRPIIVTDVWFWIICKIAGATFPLNTSSEQHQSRHSTVTLLARLRGLSTSQPRRTAMW
jgi:hypothetical protein